MTKETETTKDPREGNGFYPSFHALWHLKALGIFDGSSDTFKSAAWDAASAAGDKSAVRIVIMDTTIDWEHPNLQGVIDTAQMRDFSGINVGEAIDPKTGPTIYGAHGTAVAGLIGARPAKVQLQLRERKGLSPITAIMTDVNSETRVVDLPYAGINPFCTIIPVSLTASPDPEMVLAALDYIKKLDPKPQIIVVAAAWDDTVRAKKNEQSFDKGEKKWSDVKKVLVEICKSQLVLCAAGNSGADEMAYPASLAETTPGLIAVTACDTNGKPLMYAYRPQSEQTSRPQPKQTRIIATLSTQGTRYDSKKTFLDPWAEVDPYLEKPPGDPEFPKQRIISLDPRGRRGYNPSIYRHDPPTKGPHLEIASLYAEFSGTSAATAIAAGLISLAMQAKGKPDVTGPDLSKLPGAESLFDLSAASKLF